MYHEMEDHESFRFFCGVSPASEMLQCRTLAGWDPGCYLATHGKNPRLPQTRFAQHVGRHCLKGSGHLCSVEEDGEHNTPPCSVLRGPCKRNTSPRYPWISGSGFCPILLFASSFVSCAIYIRKYVHDLDVCARQLPLNPLPTVLKFSWP